LRCYTNGIDSAQKQHLNTLEGDALYINFNDMFPSTLRHLFSKSNLWTTTLLITILLISSLKYYQPQNTNF